MFNSLYVHAYVMYNTKGDVRRDISCFPPIDYMFQVTIILQKHDYPVKTC